MTDGKENYLCDLGLKQLSQFQFDKESKKRLHHDFSVTRSLKHHNPIAVGFTISTATWKQVFLFIINIERIYHCA